MPVAITSNKASGTQILKSPLPLHKNVTLPYKIPTENLNAPWIVRRYCAYIVMHKNYKIKEQNLIIMLHGITTN